jgi:hypothetical protein
MRWRGIDDMGQRGIDHMQWRGIDDMQCRDIDHMQRRGVDDMRRRGIDDMRCRGIDHMGRGGSDRMRWIGMDCRYMPGIYYWGCCFDSFLRLLLSVPYYMCEALLRWLRARHGLHHSWRAIRRASLFAPLKHRFSCSPAKPIVRSVPAHIALHLYVSTHFAFHLFVSTHFALHRRVRTLHTLPTQPSVRHARFFPDVTARHHWHRGSRSSRLRRAPLGPSPTQLFHPENWLPHEP